MFSSNKGKAKRPADDVDLDNPSATSTSVPRRPIKTAAPQVIRRKHHRRRNVAATIWCAQTPTQANAPGTPFNIYKALLRHPNLFFQFAHRLNPQSLIDLYAIDKEFHFRFNKYSISIIHEHAVYNAGTTAAFMFSWVLFPDLCISDPMARPMDGRPHLVRDVPGLRWTRMVVFREAVVGRILTELALEGLRVPKKSYTMLMKFWLLMEMHTMALRLAFISDKAVWSDTDIILFHLFLVRLDMRFSDPISGNGSCTLSHMLLTQKTLTKLHDVLIGKFELDYDEVTDMLVRTYRNQDLGIETHTWLADEADNGVSFEEWGLLCKENWHMTGAPLTPAADLVIMEGISRGLHSHRYLIDFLEYGFTVQNEKGEMENVPVPKWWRGKKRMGVPGGAWPVENVRKAMIEKMYKRAGVQRGERLTKTVRIPLPGATRGEMLELEAVDTTT